jgi:tetratricopeptide (TPR) repeat protein
MKEVDLAQKKTRGKGTKRKAGRGSSELEKYQKALDGLERALKSLYKGDVERAQEQLLRLQEANANETELMDRVRSYLAVCETHLSPQRRPKSTEEYVTAGVMYHNEGDFQQAIKMFTKALEMEPKSAHIAYCLAASHAQAGDAATTAKLLKQAIQSDPLNRVYARSDHDFDDVREAREIASLLAEA